MKVCVFAGTHDKSSGGSYTFESQVFEALSELIHESEHQFFVYTHSLRSLQTLEFSPQTSSTSNVALDRKPNPISAPFTQKLRASVSQIKPIKAWYQKRRLESLRQANIDVTLALSSTYLTTEIPYIPIIWDLEHKTYPFFPEFCSAGAWEQREKRYVRMIEQASIIITGTKVGKSQLVQCYRIPSERIKILPMPTPKFVLNFSSCNEKEVLQKYKIPSNYLFYPAQFWAHKNHVGLLLSCKLLRDKYNLKLHIVFSGSDQGNQSYVKEMTDELGLSEQIHFVGFITQSEVVALYRNAFALVYLSFLGPDNLPPLEAMALGCPVIASKIPGSEEQLGDAALLCDPKSTEQIAEAIKSLWEDELLRQTLIRRGKELACKWTTRDYVKGIFSTLDEFETMRRSWK